MNSRIQRVCVKLLAYSVLHTLAYCGGFQGISSLALPKEGGGMRMAGLSPLIEIGSPTSVSGVPGTGCKIFRPKVCGVSNTCGMV